jgi:hypothetical protein
MKEKPASIIAQSERRLIFQRTLASLTLGTVYRAALAAPEAECNIWASREEWW